MQKRHLYEELFVLNPHTPTICITIIYNGLTEAGLTVFLTVGNKRGFVTPSTRIIFLYCPAGVGVGRNFLPGIELCLRYGLQRVAFALE